jgi:hypothetical protein
VDAAFRATKESFSIVLAGAAEIDIVFPPVKRSSTEPSPERPRELSRLRFHLTSAVFLSVVRGLACVLTGLLHYCSQRS